MMAEKHNVLLSFPRSGNTWLRYAIEYISRMPTSASTVARCAEGVMEKRGVLSSDLDLGVDISKKAILIKRHRFDLHYDEWNSENCRLVFLMRNYKEAILRHAHASKKDHDIKEINKYFREYFHCLSSYDTFDGEKSIFYYEDLMVMPRYEIGRLVDFLEIPKGERFISFFRRFREHRRNSLRYYKPGAMTAGKSTKLSWHSSRVSTNMVRKMEEIAKAHELYDKYLKRYE